MGLISRYREKKKRKKRMNLQNTILLVGIYCTMQVLLIYLYEESKKSST